MNDWMILVQVQVQVMSKFGDAEVDQVFAIGYMDKSSGIDYQEFVSMMVPNSVATINSDCQITRNEMKNGMRCYDGELDIFYGLFAHAVKPRY